MGENGDRRGGCSKGIGCKDFHPKVCYESMESKTCSRRNCRFYHLNGTKQTESIESPHRLSEPQIQDSRGPVRVLQRNNPEKRILYNNSLVERPSQETNGDIMANNGMSSSFFIMEQKIQRIEVMLGAILQSVRPPSLTARLPDP